jgi:hypothetical protein
MHNDDIRRSGIIKRRSIRGRQQGDKKWFDSSSGAVNPTDREASGRSQERDE